MNVRAKFKVSKNSDGRVELEAVTSGSEENKRFFKYTPGGSIKMNVVNEAAAERFVVGREAYVDFTFIE